MTRDDASLIQNFLLMVSVMLFLYGCGGSGCPMSITTEALPTGTVGEEYHAELESSCGGDAWLIKSGDLPPGISLTGNGVLSGTPTHPGNFTFTIELVDYAEESLFEDEETSYREPDRYTYKGFAVTIESSAGEFDMDATTTVNGFELDTTTTGDKK